MATDLTSNSPVNSFQCKHIMIIFVIQMCCYAHISAFPSAVALRTCSTITIVKHFFKGLRSLRRSGRKFNTRLRLIANALVLYAIYIVRADIKTNARDLRVEGGGGNTKLFFFSVFSKQKDEKFITSLFSVL